MVRSKTLSPATGSLPRMVVVLVQRTIGILLSGRRVCPVRGTGRR